MVGLQRHNELWAILNGKELLGDGAPELICCVHRWTILAKKHACINHQMKIVAASRCIEVKRAGIINVFIVSAYRFFARDFGFIVVAT